MPSQHTVFQNNTKSILLSKLQFSRALPIGAWQNRFTRPDVLITQDPLWGRAQDPGKRGFNGFYTEAFMVECKIEARDLEKSPFQLLLAVMAFRGNGMLDLRHGGLRPVLAMPTTLRDSMEAAGTFQRVVKIFEELAFGIFVVDVPAMDFEPIRWPGTFMSA